jgi:hypothetical protein
LIFGATDLKPTKGPSTHTLTAQASAGLVYRSADRPADARAIFEQWSPTASAS